MINLKKFANQAAYEDFVESPNYVEPHVSIIEGVPYPNYNLPPKIYTFYGYQISPGPLYYNGDGFEIEDHWNYDSYNSVYGLNTGSYCLPVSYGYETSIYPLNDNIWQIPSKFEWGKIIGTTTGYRSGATVNNQQNKHYAILQLTGVQHAGTTTPVGLLLFPDNETITGCTLTYMDEFGENIINSGITESQLNEYLAQGCAFLPASGYYSYGSWSGGGTNGIYVTSTDCLPSGYYSLSFSYGQYNNTNSLISLTGIVTGFGTIRCVHKLLEVEVLK